jgi:thioredoxin-related protein
LEYVVGFHYLKETYSDYLERADPPPKFEENTLNEQSFFIEQPYLLDRSRFKAETPLAIFFERHRCHACDILHTELLADQRILGYCVMMEVVQLDMWSDTPVLTPSGSKLTARQWADELDIHYAPTILFFDDCGREIIRIDSVVLSYRLMRVFQYVAERGYETGLNYQQWHGKRRAAKVALSVAPNS